MQQLFKKLNTIIIFLLILLDQLVKLVIYHYFIGQQYEWINPLAFKPTLNDDYSFANSLFQLKIGSEIHVIIIALALIMMISVYKYILSHNSSFKAVNLGFNLLISGSICSMIDKLFWGGSLDYICLKGYFIFDLKDFYITLAEIILVVLVIVKRQFIIDFRLGDLLRFIKKSILE